MSIPASPTEYGAADKHLKRSIGLIGLIGLLQIQARRLV